VELFLHSHFAAALRGRPVAVVLFDIDRFKEYNDAHGHAAGDAALKRVASVMHSLTRDMDVCGRWGGEEFLAVLTGADERGAAVFAERVRKRVETLPVGYPVTISGGIATYRQGMGRMGDLIDAADAALYRAKTDGRNRVRSAGDMAPSALTEDRP
jgi:diguanylate cyclase (GGDEF)-like protein